MHSNSYDLQRHAGKYYGKYSGVVTNNEDANQQGCITVQVPTIFDAAEVIARPCLPFGHFFVPPVGAHVWVEFEAGDLEYPLWVGVWYPQGAAPPQAAITPPDNRVIQTPSGHTIQIMDKEGEEKIIIQHKSNSVISIDHNGSILITNKNGSHIHFDVEHENASFVEQHGNLITMNNDGLVLVNKDGAMVELKGTLARIVTSDIALQGAKVALGQEAAEPTIMGQTFANLWNVFINHTHNTSSPGAPTLTPLPPALPLMPGKGLTTAVLVK